MIRLNCVNNKYAYILTYLYFIFSFFLLQLLIVSIYLYLLIINQNRLQYSLTIRYAVRNVLNFLCSYSSFQKRIMNTITLIQNESHMTYTLLSLFCVIAYKL